MRTLDDTTPRIGYVGGFVTGEVRIGGICYTRVRIHREFWFARDDVGGEWTVCVQLPEKDSGGDDTVGGGSILVTEPTANQFMEMLVRLIADPEAIGEATFGPAPTAMATGTA